MIKKIEITKKNNTIPKGFQLELGQMTIITGVNNSGKTNFIKAVNDENKVKFFDSEEKELAPRIVYISAENIRPSDSECKSSAKSTGLVKNLSELFSNLEVEFKLEKEDEIIEHIENLIKKANKNLETFTEGDEYKLKMNPNRGGLDSDIMIQALIKDIIGCEGDEERKLEDLGQGTQRVIVASVLKAYIDILIEKKIHTEKPILILFEEPEIYLHPKLKRTLNATLEKIAEQDKHQIIITTHDPYFAFLNFEEEGKSIFSFEKEGMITKISDKNVVSGIEDELLFIFLYNLLEKKKRSKDLLTEKVEGFENREWKDSRKPVTKGALKYIRDQIHHLGSSEKTIGLVHEKTKDCDDKNYYTEKELESAIKKMCEMLKE